MDLHLLSAALSDKADNRSMTALSAPASAGAPCARCRSAIFALRDQNASHLTVLARRQRVRLLSPAYCLKIYPSSTFWEISPSAAQTAPPPPQPKTGRAPMMKSATHRSS